jgi:glycosyltransferase involved in cell wall biosynthesis
MAPRGAIKGIPILSALQMGVAVPNPNSGEQPFFTIGVPTFNRHDLLRETLNSILAQGFTDFEIIVGNDFTAETLTCDMLGIFDPRIRIVNYPENLREVGNMNALLGMASGRYFTWLFDDDLYEPDFLQTAYDYLEKTGFPPAFFSSFRMMRVSEKFQPRKVHFTTSIELTGREFLRWYSESHPQIGSTCGLFDTTALRKTVGGVEELCSSVIGIYCEYLFLVKCALLGRIIYIDAPFYVYRRHADSASESNVDMENHLVAGQELVRRCGEVLRHPTLVDDYSASLLKICKIHIITFAYISSRYEFAQKKFGIGTVYRALSRHSQESLRTRKLYIGQGGDSSSRTRLAFLKVNIFCSYLIVRLLAHFVNKSLR